MSKREETIRENLPLVRYIAQRYKGAEGVDLQDLISVGSIGLIKAVSGNHEQGKYTQFIENEILMHLRVRKSENDCCQKTKLRELTGKHNRLLEFTMQLLAIIDLHKHGKQYRFMYNDSELIYSREACKELTFDEVIKEIGEELPSD